MSRSSLSLSLVFVLMFAAFARGQVPSSPGDWPQWRGPNRDGLAKEQGLLKEWPKEGPKLLWSVDNAGVGYSSVAVKDGRIITQGDLDGVEHTIAINASNGQRLWAVQPKKVAELLAKRIDTEFARMDRNGDGKVDEPEALQQFGWRFNDFDSTDSDAEPDDRAAARAKSLFAAFDKNDDGALEFEETVRGFQEKFSQIDKSDPAADAEALAAKRTALELKTLDGDGDGKLSRQETRPSVLGREFNRVDKRDPTTKRGDGQLTRDEILEYFQVRQKGRDGRVSQAELAAYYLARHSKGDGLLTKAELRSALGGYRNGMGNGPRGTPTIDDDRVYVEGGNGDVSCLNLETGATIWHVNLSSDHKGGRPGWGYSESPLVEGDLVIVTPGGNQGSLVALDKSTGAEVWRSGEITDRAHYASPVAHDIGGVRQIVQFARKGVFGVAAKDGRLLWSYNAPANGTANCATPIVHRDHVFGSSAYGTGGGLAKISRDGEAFKTEEVYFEKRMANHHGGIVLYKDHMYGFGSGGLICMDFLSGEIKWRSRSVGKGSLLIADGMLYLLGEGHQVALAEATPEEYREKGRFRIKSLGRPSWAHPVVADGKLLIRNQGSLAAYQLRP